MNDVATELRSEIDKALPRLRSMSEARAAEGRGPGKWVRKEILGHLIDSAANNHQRFVRGRLADRLVTPGYEQDAWVLVHKYRERPWTELIDLWAALNRHMALVLETTPAERRQTPCVVGNEPEATLEWVARDYVRHLRHHLAQILDR